MSSKSEEQRITVLEADPDGIDWKARQATPAPTGPLTWIDAMLSLLMNLSGFHEIFARRMRAHLGARRQANGTVDAHEATTAALLEVLVDLERARRLLLRDGLDRLELAGVPRAELTPQLVGQDWRASSLTDAGVLDMRVKVWVRRAPSTFVELERRCAIVIPRGAKSIQVRKS